MNLPRYLNRGAGNLSARPAGASPAVFAVVAVLMAGLCCTLFAGCFKPAEGPIADDQLAKANAQVGELTIQNRKLTDQIAQQDQRILSLLNLGDKRLDKLFHVKTIWLGDATGGFASDGREERDDSIKVYLQPMDADGSVIKAAGDVKIQVFDLAADPKNNLVGEFKWSVDQVGKNWASGMFSYHYSFVCPWKTPPAHSELTVRVEFVDYLTGEHFSAQKVCKVKLAPQTPASLPAK